MDDLSDKKKRRRGGKRGGKKHGFDKEVPASKRPDIKPSSPGGGGGGGSNAKGSGGGNGATAALVARWHAKEEVVRLNKQISEHAQRKQLSQALQCFSELGSSANQVDDAIVPHPPPVLARL